MAYSKVTRNPAYLVEEFANWFNALFQTDIQPPSQPHPSWEAPLQAMGFTPMGPPPPPSKH